MVLALPVLHRFQFNETHFMHIFAKEFCFKNLTSAQVYISFNLQQVNKHAVTRIRLNIFLFQVGTLSYLPFCNYSVSSLLICFYLISAFFFNPNIISFSLIFITPPLVFIFYLFLFHLLSWWFRCKGPGPENSILSRTQSWLWQRLLLQKQTFPISPFRRLHCWPVILQSYSSTKVSFLFDFLCNPLSFHYFYILDCNPDSSKISYNPRTDLQ